MPTWYNDTQAPAVHGGMAAVMKWLMDAGQWPMGAANLREPG